MGVGRREGEMKERKWIKICSSIKIIFKKYEEEMMKLIEFIGDNVLAPLIITLRFQVLKHIRLF